MFGVNERFFRQGTRERRFPGIGAGFRCRSFRIKISLSTGHSSRSNTKLTVTSNFETICAVVKRIKSASDCELFRLLANRWMVSQATRLWSRATHRCAMTDICLLVEAGPNEVLLCEAIRTSAYYSSKIPLGVTFQLGPELLQLRYLLAQKALLSWRIFGL
jgi:hypothetical protein